MANRARQVEALLTETVTNKNWNRVAEICENWELESANLEVPITAGYFVHLIAYIIINDLNNARFLWKRIPADTKKAMPELAALWRVGQAQWNRNYSELYASLSGYAWPPQFTALVMILAETLRNNAFALLSKAYTNISVESAAAMLGLSPQETVEKTTQAGWTYQAETKLLIPKVVPEPKIQTTSLDQLRQLTDYVVYLDQQ